MPPLKTLKARAEFLAVRGGARASVASCLIEARRRPLAASAPDAAPEARFGFTVTKKLGNAVTRNRIRRRLKAAVRELAGAGALPGYDYVVVARAAAFDRPFMDMRADIEKAFAVIRQSGHKPSHRAKNAFKRGPA